MKVMRLKEAIKYLDKFDIFANGSFNYNRNDMIDEIGEHLIYHSDEIIEVLERVSDMMLDYYSWDGGITELLEKLNHFEHDDQYDIIKEENK